MGIGGKALFAVVVALAFCASAAHAQQAVHSSLGLNLGRVDRPIGNLRAQGLSLSVVGHASLVPSLGVFGKIGTAYGRTDTSVMGNAAAMGPDVGYGFAYGGGVSYAFSPRLSASLEWDSYDLRLPVGPVRSTSLGLQYRY